MEKLILLLLLGIYSISNESQTFGVDDLLGQWNVYETKIDENDLPKSIGIKHMLEINSSKSKHYTPKSIIITTDSIFLKNPMNKIIVRSRIDVTSISAADAEIKCNIDDTEGKFVMKSSTMASLNINGLTYYLKKI